MHGVDNVQVINDELNREIQGNEVIKQTKSLIDIKNPGIDLIMKAAIEI